MKMHVTESIWLNETGVCSTEYLAEASGLSIEEINDLIECGIIATVDKDAPPASVQLHHVTTAQTARRLRDDFQLDRHGVALALTLLRRIEALEADLKATQAQRKTPDTRHHA
ncbi:MAG TPA: chaperone modulator CbpM [Paucimonas sp.]|nr:chaperone modulator CbpM [Paucimonas sp.]HJW55615.1 chaperone modulator CbpM [Burkholderiaceae bacterium]